MAEFQRSLFNKPISETEQGIASGTNISMFSIPTNKLGFLKRIQANNPTASGINVEIWDNYQDPTAAALAAAGVSAPAVLASGLEKRKDIHIPSNIEQINWNEDEDIPLLGEVFVRSDTSGLDVTVTARTM